MTVASASGDDSRNDRLAPLAIEVLAIGRRSWGEDWVPERRVVAPGRIELLGNHLDYNGGRVLAGAIDRVILLLGAEGTAPDRIAVGFTDPDTDRHVQDELTPSALRGWQRDAPPESPIDYVRGAIAALIEAGHEIRSSWRFAFGGNLPVGLGVSSSAALSVGLVMQLAEGELDARDTILLAQAAENRAGVSSGTMDQAASVAGGVIRYDAAAVSFERLDPDLGDRAFVVISSGVVHRLGESAYPVRVRETRGLLEIAKQEFGDDAPPNTARLSSDQVSRLMDAGLLDDTLAGRARHVVSEGKRVDAGYDALVAGDWATFGRLMSESGRSSATDYDVSHPQVEELVAEVNAVEGVLGARMMGGGGGGSVLALVERDVTGRLEERVGAGYFARHDLTDLPDRFLVCTFADGAASERLNAAV